MVTSKTIALGIAKGVGILVLAALGLYFLYQIQAVLIYLVVAFILTLIGNPILDFFKRRLKFNHLAATIAGYGFCLAIKYSDFMTHILGHIAMQRETAITRGEKNNVMKSLYLMARQNP